jgi:ABC-type phosphate transport system substrate-binding protein
MRLIILAALFSQVLGQSFNCGGDGEIVSRGSTTVLPITVRCAARYTQLCKNVTIVTNGTSTLNGARSVCGDTSMFDTPNDIGNMSRDFKPTEATRIEGKPGFFRCVIGDRTREVIRMPVAIDGLTLAVDRGNSLYTNCISKVQSFDVKIIRWMYSNLTNLEEDRTTLYNFDKNPATKSWQEVDAVCPDIPIIPIGPREIYGSTEYFKQIVFTGGTSEGFRSQYRAMDDNSVAIRDALLNNRGSVAYLNFAFYSANNASLAALPVDSIYPSKDTLEDNTYALFARRIYSVYLDEENSLKKTKCFGDFTYTRSGNIQVQATGFVPIPESDVPILLSLLPGTCQQSGKTEFPTPIPTRKPVCRCLRILRILRLCCRKNYY